VLGAPGNPSTGARRSRGSGSAGRPGPPPAPSSASPAVTLEAPRRGPRELGDGRVGAHRRRPPASVPDLGAVADAASGRGRGGRPGRASPPPSVRRRSFEAPRLGRGSSGTAVSAPARRTSGGGPRRASRPRGSRCRRERSGSRRPSGTSIASALRPPPFLRGASPRPRELGDSRVGSGAPHIRGRPPANVPGIEPAAAAASGRGRGDRPARASPPPSVRRRPLEAPRPAPRTSQPAGSSPRRSPRNSRGRPGNPRSRPHDFTTRLSVLISSRPWARQAAAARRVPRGPPERLQAGFRGPGHRRGAHPRPARSRRRG
jgi:hypothetical protein